MQLVSSWAGSEFLIVYSVLLVAGSVLAWWLPAGLRDAGRSGDSLDAESIAFLVGGPDRFADAVLADLFVHGALEQAGTDRLAVVRRDLPVGLAGRALLQAGPSLTIGEARRIIALQTQRIAARLRRSGMLLWPEQHARLRWLSVAPFAALLVLGLYRQRAQTALGEPTGFLLILLALTVILALLRFLRSDPRTRAGIAAVGDLRTDSALAPGAQRPEDASLAVALFGTGVLVGTPWEPVHRLGRKNG